MTRYHSVHFGTKNLKGLRGTEPSPIVEQRPPLSSLFLHLQKTKKKEFNNVIIFWLKIKRVNALTGQNPHQVPISLVCSYQSSRQARLTSIAHIAATTAGLRQTWIGTRFFSRPRNRLHWTASLQAPISATPRLFVAQALYYQQLVIRLADHTHRPQQNLPLSKITNSLRLSWCYKRTSPQNIAIVFHNSIFFCLLSAVFPSHLEKNRTPECTIRCDW